MARLACVIIILMALTLVCNIQLGQGCSYEYDCDGGGCEYSRTKGEGCWKFPGLSGCYQLSTIVSMLNAAGNL